VAVARAINHSLSAVERYLEDFKRVSLLAMKGLDAVAIARAANLSPALVKTYQAMYQEAKDRPVYATAKKDIRILTCLGAQRLGRAGWSELGSGQVGIVG